MKKTDPYPINREYLDSPTLLLNQNLDVERSKLDWIQDLITDAEVLDDRIAGDFDLENIKYDIFTNDLAFVRQGLLFFKIKVFKLYKKVSASFKDFCQTHLHKSHWQANNLIRAAKVVCDLIANGFSELPKNEAQCRSLLANCEEKLSEAWQYVLDWHKEELHKITAESIGFCLTLKTKPPKEEPKKTFLNITGQLYKAIWEKATKESLSVIAYLEELFLGKQNGDNFHQKLKIKRWEEEEALNQDYYHQRWLEACEEEEEELNYVYHYPQEDKKIGLPNE